MGREGCCNVVPSPQLETRDMIQNAVYRNHDDIGELSLAERDEQRFIRFVKVARLDIAVPAIFAATIIILFFLGLAMQVLRAGSSILVAYTFIYFISLLVLILPHRALFVELLRGDLSTRAMWIYGLAPSAIMVLVVGLVTWLLSFLANDPAYQFAPNLIFGPRDIAALLLAPFGEEIVFRVWLQTRLQQGFGKVGDLLGGARLRPWFSAAGAVLCALLFLANHANGFAEWSIYALAAWLTWLRYRHRSLGAALIAHIGWNAGLLLVGILVLSHVLK